MPATLFVAACISIVSNRLPFVRQYNHAIATEIPVTATTYTGNDCPTLSPMGGKNNGKCQHAQITPRKILATGRPSAADKRGSANPRQPISSPACTGVETAVAMISRYHGVLPNGGQTAASARCDAATAILITSMYVTASTYHRRSVGARAIRARIAPTPSRPSLCATSASATTAGATVPASSRRPAASDTNPAPGPVSRAAANHRLQLAT